MSEFKWKYFSSENEWVRKPPMHWIVEFTRERKPYYFTEGTLDFFNQKISDFKVVIVNKRLFVYAPDKNALGSGKTCYTLAEVTTDGNIGSLNYPGLPPTSESQVLSILKDLED